MIRDLIITQLAENTAGGPGLLAEHGVSFHIEADEVTSAVRYRPGIRAAAQFILSHGHYDHASGLMEALELTGPVVLYLHPEALEAKFNRNGREIGSPIDDMHQLEPRVKQVIPTRQPTEILPGIHVTGEIPRKHPIEDTGGPFCRMRIAVKRTNCRMTRRSISKRLRVWSSYWAAATPA